MAVRRRVSSSKGSGRIEQVFLGCRLVMMHALPAQACYCELEHPLPQGHRIVTGAACYCVVVAIRNSRAPINVSTLYVCHVHQSVALHMLTLCLLQTCMLVEQRSSIEPTILQVS